MSNQKCLHEIYENKYCIKCGAIAYDYVKYSLTFKYIENNHKTHKIFL